MKGRKELRGRVAAVLVGIAVGVSLTLASSLSHAGNNFVSGESDAIGGTGTDAIAGTGVDAIGGTGGRIKRRTGNAIDGTGVDAIGGTGTDAIAGTGVYAIDAIAGTGVDAIGGTGGRVKRRTSDAIGGTGTDAIAGTGTDAIAGTGKTASFLLRGPVDSANLSASSVTVFGRDFRLPSDRARSIHDALAGGQTVVLAISGKLGRKGELLLAKATIDQEQYAAGSSQVILSGRVRALDLSIGKAVIGKQVVDLTPAVSSFVKAGDVVVVVGTQPSLKGAISAQLVLRAD
jgi:hypothetical protein